MSKLNIQKGFLIVLSFSILFGGNFLFSESGIYDRIGIIPEHGFHGAVPEENIDLFTGNLTLRFLDIYLPGPNGFDLKIWRVYNSKILKDRLPASAWGFQQEPYSWVGMGWTMHMGRVHNFNSDTPVIEFPDGRWETAYLKTGSSAYVTRDFLKYDKDNYKLYFKDGTVWIFGEQKKIKYGDSEVDVRVVTRIENSFGHYIDITYPTGSVPTITKITDSMQREINFVTSGTTNPKLTTIYVKDAHGNISNYYYTVGTFSYGGYFQLTAYDPPELPAATYEYYSGEENKYELTTVNTSFGGEMKYEYADHTFYFYTYSLDTRVVNKKEIKFSSSSSYKTWNYTYPDYHNTTTGTVSIDGPDFDTEVTYHAYDSAALWKIGLLKNKSFTDGSYSEGHEWLPQVISSKHWYVLSRDMGYATAPLISKVIRTRKGDAESEEWYLYERSSVKDYGLPTKIKYYANDSLKSYKTLEYYFETSTTFENNYMLSHIWKEKDYSSGGMKLKETQTTYFDTSGKCGAIDEIKRLKSGSTYYTWDYTYSSPNPYEITITVNLPGSAGTETYEYRHGILSKIVRPGYTELIRTISTHDSSILTETNQHGGTMDFTYDGLGRIEEIDMPSVFNDINAVWSTNSVTITQGGNTVVKYWDGMGRDTGYEETGDGITLYYRKTLDSEGRVIAENKGSTSSSDKYIYELTALGQVKKITDPRGKITNISYSGDKKTLTDPEGNITEFEYNNLPGLVAKLKDAEGRYADYTYDGIGRLTEVKYNNSRTQNFSYNGLDSLTEETHPEAGAISYTYNSENNISKKNWEGKEINYSYNSSNQLTSTNSGDETVTYEYDSNGRVKKISSNKGWYRDNIQYNSLGSITSERQYTPGLGAKTLTYTYDNNNNLNSIVYPDESTLIYTNNGLNMPETANFNAKSLIGQMTYSINKQPAYMDISGNGTEFNAAYNSSGFLSSASLKKSGIVLYNSSYEYDGVGNITSISNDLDASFGYDSLNRLTSAAYTPYGVGRVDSFSYTYDEYGNMKTVKEDGNTIFSKTYTSKNQISGYSYDDRGNLTSDSNYQYVWDNQNRLEEVKNVGEASLGSYLYDERGLRLKATKEPLPPALPEINVKQGTTNIPDGGSFNFGSREVGTNTDKTFTIENTGEGDLTLSGSPIIQITGEYANQFSVQQQPTSPVSPGNSTTFIIRFSPTSEGSKTASISIANNDSDENPYNITLNGTGFTSEPEMNVKQGEVSIPDDGISRYGTHEVGTNTDVTLTIENTGEGDLILSGSPIIQISGTHADQFSVQQQPTTPVSPQSNTIFIIRFSPTSEGDKFATISISNNDSNENPYDIMLVGTGFIPQPEINIKQGTTYIPDGGSFNFGTREIFTNTDKTFTIENAGDGDLTLSGSPIIQITGPHANQFSVQQQPTSPVSPGNSTSFIIRFRPTSEGSKTASISIANNDSNENPYDIALNGTGYDPYEPPDDPKPPEIPESVDPVHMLSGNDGSRESHVPEPPLTVTFPNDGEQLRSGSLQNITWISDDSIRNVKIEYSTDNGSTYQTIVERATNTGTYQWEVPQEISHSCLIRISNADGPPSIPELFTFEFKFKISRPQNAFQWYPDFVVSLGVPDEKALSSKFADLSFIADETNGYEDIMFNYNMAESLNLELFLEKWHHVRVEFDMNNYSGSVWLDDQLIFEDILLETDINFKSSSEISMSCNRDVPVRIWIEDLRVEMKDPNFRPQDETTEKLVFLESIVIDNFDIYTSGEFPEQGGWSVGQKNIRREEFRDKDIFVDSQNRRLSVTGEEFLAKRNYYIIDNKEFVSGTQSFKLESSEDSSARVVKRFSLPARVPFDISDGNFAIVAESFEGDEDRHEQDFKYRELERKKRILKQEEDGYTREYLSGAHEAHNNIPESSQMSDGNVEEQNNSDITNSIRMLSGSPESTYYIYSFDGKLLAEYNTDGVCVREYIYMGNQLMAEYRPQENNPENKYYYYTSDQINSIRMITNDSGTRVYSAAYDPYGGIQKTWENIYDPKLKFSGKERDGDTGLDYFGARYYGYSSYRFISVDPVISREEAISNPQLWNLYSYCRNNPVTFVDPYGEKVKFAPGSTPKFISQVNQMRKYLVQSRSAKTILRTLERIPQIVYIKESKYLGEMAYIHKESTILVNPLEGLRVEEGPFKGMIQSPSLGFIHECIHGMHHLENSNIYINKLNPKASIEGEYGNKYRTLEEWITVIIERRIASQLGESLRYSSKGVSVLVKSPISKEELK